MNLKDATNYITKKLEQMKSYTRGKHVTFSFKEITPEQIKEIWVELSKNGELSEVLKQVTIEQL